MIQTTVIPFKSSPPKWPSLMGVVIGCLMMGQGLFGQGTIEVGTPTNLDCASAFTIWGDVVFDYTRQEGDPLPDRGYACLWFRFCVVGPEPITVMANSLTAVVQSRPTAYLFRADAGCDVFRCSIAKPFEESFLGGQELEYDTPIEIEDLGEYYLVWMIDLSEATDQIVITLEETHCIEPDPICPECLTTFAPLPEKTYRISAWVTKEDLPVDATTVFEGGDPYVRVECPVGAGDLVQDLEAQGPVIDGWQLIEGWFTMPEMPPSGPLEMRVSMGTTDEEHAAYFDDVRVFPDKASMKSYVYDPRSLRFVAELDERHFATFYEYDSEGRLVRVKKETERGVMTIKEVRQHSARLPDE